MSDSNRSYVTTSIPYVNARPHLGFALELCIADAYARHRRRRGRDVRFVTGTDDHSLKNVLAAERAGVPTPEYVARHAAAFEALRDALRVSADDFLRTSASPGHAPAVRAIWAGCAARGDLYRRPFGYGGPDRSRLTRTGPRPRSGSTSSERASRASTPCSGRRSSRPPACPGRPTSSCTGT